MRQNDHSTNNESTFAAHHGGDVFAVASEFGIAPESLLDFSANINPLGAPAGALRQLQQDAANVELLMRYPDRELTVLRRALGAHCRVSENQIIIANGAAALIAIAIRAVAQIKRNPRCLLPVPAFSEYERALRAAGFETSTFALARNANFVLDENQLIKRLEREKPALCIINNPHNPSGALVEKEKMRLIIRQANQVKTVVLLDEAFIDYVPEESLTTEIGEFENLIVLRSLTKFFAIPALRVGYAVVSGNLKNRLSEQIESWSVTTLAANAAAAALADADYAGATRRTNRAELEFLRGALCSIGFDSFPSAANFLLVEPPAHVAAKTLRAELIVKHGIVVRDCSVYKALENTNLIRIAVRNRQENVALAQALQTVTQLMPV